MMSGPSLGLVVTLTAAPGQRERILAGLVQLFDRIGAHPSCQQARIYRAVEVDRIVLVERWADTLDGLQARATASPDYAAFEAEFGGLIVSRTVQILDGAPVATFGAGL